MVMTQLGSRTSKRNLERRNIIRQEHALYQRAHLELGELLGVELGHLFAEGHRAENLLELRLVDEGGEPAVDVAVRLPESKHTSQ